MTNRDAKHFQTLAFARCGVFFTKGSPPHCCFKHVNMALFFLLYSSLERKSPRDTPFHPKHTLSIGR